MLHSAPAPSLVSQTTNFSVLLVKYSSQRDIILTEASKNYCSTNYVVYIIVYTHVVLHSCVLETNEIDTE